MTRALPLFAALLVGLLAPAAHGQAAAGQPPEDVRVLPVDRSIPPLQRLVTLRLRDVTLATALRAIDHQADLRLGYTERLVASDRRVSLSARAMPAGEALRRVLAGSGLAVQQSSAGELTIVRAPAERGAARADTVGKGILVGRVVDTVGTEQLLSGARVQVKGTSLSAVTNSLGVYFIRDVPAGLRTVSVRLLGYKPTDVDVIVQADTGIRLDIVLPRSITRLQEVVTTATGRQRRLEIPNTITVVDVDSVVKTMPVATVSELLATRVPGLVAQASSGAPGAPVRLRLRGIGAVYGNNDPIFIVDGHRVYSRQSDSTSRSLAEIGTFEQLGNTAALAVIDQIDVNSIETVEVVSGPSAAALYGADAANGVIVITTKRGRPGPARWDASIDVGTSYMPGDYPRGYFRFGRVGGSGEPSFCRLQDFSCVADSLVRAQSLNQDDLTLFGRGSRARISTTVSGGTEALRYRLTASRATEQGILKLPDVQAAQFARAHGFAAPGWMRRPQESGSWSVSSGVAARLGTKVDVDLTSSLSQSTTQTSPLSGEIPTVMTSYYDRGTGIAYRDGTVGQPADMQSSYDLVQRFSRRSRLNATTFTNGVTARWRPLEWLTTSADVGLNVISRRDDALQPRGYSRDRDSVGLIAEGQGGTRVLSGGVRATASRKLPWRSRFDLNVGADYAHTTTNFLTGNGRNIIGGNSLNSATEIDIFEGETDVTKVGLSISPMLARGNLYLTTGVRFDAANTYGQDRQLIGLPKLGLSWMISEEPFFDRLESVINALQLRVAYGHAGSEPAPGDRLRLYREGRPWIDGRIVDGSVIDRIGNTELRPQRVQEVEGGFDAELADGRIGLGVTGYRKTTVDALMSVPVPPSVYGDNVSMLRNVGVIRNTGTTVTLRAELVQTAPVAISTSVHASTQDQTMVRLGRGVEPFETEAGRVEAGYPVFGRWARPILGYADVNGNGLIETSEVRLGDTKLYMGSSMPDFTGGFSTSISLFRAALSVNADFSFTDGMTQQNGLIRTNDVFSRGLNDPSTPLGEQAAMAVIGMTDYGILQTVNTLRFNGLAISYRPPTALAQRLGARAMAISLQGTNLGLRTNYRGKDPDVNLHSTGNAVEDTGVLPEPRTWQMRVNLNF